MRVAGRHPGEPGLDLIGQWPFRAWALIDRALEPDPDKRISTPAEFWSQLEAIARPSRD